jgi:hypothetical protein
MLLIPKERSFCFAGIFFLKKNALFVLERVWPIYVVSLAICKKLSYLFYNIS